MTIWLPELRGRTGPKYQAIAQAMADAIAGGDLSPGDKLPPQRDLAYDLGVTLGTVTRAYRELREQGLVHGEVGRGTFVAPAVSDTPSSQAPSSQMTGSLHGQAAKTFTSSIAPGPGSGSAPIDRLYEASPSDTATNTVLLGGTGRFELASNYALNTGVGPLIAAAMDRMGQTPHLEKPHLEKPQLDAMPQVAGRHSVLEQLSRYQYRNGLTPHREAAREWFDWLGIETDVDDLLITPGAQAGTMVALMALTRPGDMIAVEALTWPGLAATAAPLGLSIRGLAMDSDGLIPDAFERQCRENRPKLLYLLPTLQNPTASVMSEARRREIAAVARRFEIPIVEDDVYGHLVTDAPPPVRVFCPELGVYVNSLSKAISPALRTGYVQAPEGRMNAFIGAMRCSFLMTSPLSVEIASEMIRGGEAAEMVRRQREEVAIRQDAVQRHLGNLGVQTHPQSLHCWLPVPEGQTEAAFRTALLERSVGVTPGDAFAMDDRIPPTPPHVRICLGAEPNIARLEKALSIVSDVARRSDEPLMTYV